MFYKPVADIPTFICETIYIDGTNYITKYLAIKDNNVCIMYCSCRNGCLLVYFLPSCHVRIDFYLIHITRSVST